MSNVKDPKLGKEGKDKVTGFKGIIIGKIQYLTGCNQYGLAPPYNEEKQTRGTTEWFDEGRVEIVGDGVKQEDVLTDENGADYNRDAPTGN